MTIQLARRSRRMAALVAVLVLLGALALMIAAGPTPARAATPFSRGDVFAAVGNGKVDEYTNTGTLVQHLDTTTASSETTGMCFDSLGNLYATSFEANKVSKFDKNGNLVSASWGSAFTSPESCVRNSSDQIYVGNAQGTHEVLKFDGAGNALDNATPAAESRGTDWIDLAADGCTLRYTSEGALIKQYNFCTKTQLADFASGLPSPCFSVRIRPNGEVLVACTTAVVRLNASGGVIQTYPRTSFATSGDNLFAMNLDPDGTTFWTAGYSTHNIYRVNIASGAQVTTFVAASSSTLAGLGIFGELTSQQTSPSPSPAASVLPTLPRAGQAGSTDRSLTLLLAFVVVGVLAAASALALRRRS